MNRDEDLKLIVEAPQQMKAVTVKTMSGDLQVRGITAEATVLETMSGDATPAGSKRGEADHQDSQRATSA